MQSLKKTRSKMLADDEVKAEYEGLADAFEIARELIAARTEAALTQIEVAQRMGTTQSVVARLESGKTMPSLRSIQRYAQAIGARAVVRLEWATKRPKRKPAA